MGKGLQDDPFGKYESALLTVFLKSLSDFSHSGAGRVLQFIGLSSGAFLRKIGSYHYNDTFKKKVFFDEKVRS